MTQLDTLALAQQGDVDAIASLLNQTLQTAGITAKASQKEDCLRLILEADKPLNPEKTVAYIRQSVSTLIIHPQKIQVYGRRTDKNIFDWSEELEVTIDDFVALAQQGNLKAIAFLIEQWLLPHPVKTTVNFKDTCLQVMLESNPVPPKTIVPLLQEKLVSLNLQAYQTAKVYAKQLEEDFPEWQQDINLILADPPSALQQPTKKPAFWQSATSRFKEVTDTVTTKSQAVVDSSKSLANNAAKFKQDLLDKSKPAMANVPKTWQLIGEKSTEVSSLVGGATGQATVKVGGAIALVRKHPLLQKATQSLQVDWLLKFIEQIDVVQAEEAVKQLQQKYPHEQPQQIAQRLMREKALLAGGMGLASLVPGVAIAMLGVDLATTAALQTEMIYQIAAAYGQDLQDPDIITETLAIFGVALGGSLAIEAGLGLLGTIPVAGAVIGASTSAAMMYAVGYAACRFYESKVNPLTNEATLAASQVESEKYLKQAITQEAIADQILVHLVLAGNTGKTWEEILPNLRSLNLSPASLATIAANFNAPPSLESLLGQINEDFAIPLLVQCEKMAQLDGVVTSEEAKIIETITQKLGIDLDAMKAQVVSR